LCERKGITKQKKQKSTIKTQKHHRNKPKPLQQKKNSQLKQQTEYLHLKYQIPNNEKDAGYHKENSQPSNTENEK